MFSALESVEGWKTKTVAFGSDGAAVMVGAKKGVATLLKADIPHVISIHCVAHRLELAAMDSIKDEPEMKRVSDMLIG